MAGFQAIENVLLAQTHKLQDLETATSLIQSKSTIQDDILEAHREISSISKGISGIKEDVITMKLENDRMRELLMILRSLDSQIQHMENNVPPKLQEYILSKKTCPINNSQPTTKCAEKILNNDTTHDSFNTNGNNGNALVNNIKNCKKTLFNEPDIPCIRSITEEEFTKIPKYIIARYTFEALNSLVSNINQIIKTKYSLIALGKNGARKKGELDLYLHYKKEQTSLGSAEGKTYFFTPEDFERYIKTKLDKTKLNLLIALRHCKRLREIRTAKTVHYALILHDQ